MEIPKQLLPDVELDLPSEWTWQQQHKPPLGLMPETGEGALQISTPTTSPSWRDYSDLAPLVRQFAEGSRLGRVLRVETGETRYGRFASAECVAKEHGDVCAWLFVPETNDPLVITWIAESPTEEGKTARRIVQSLRPGLFSAAVSIGVAGARDEIAKAGSITPVTLLICEERAEIVCLNLPFDDDSFLVEGIRHERARLNAAVVVRIGMAEVRLPDRAPERVGFVYAEGSTRRKRFLLPFSARGQEVTEVDASSVAVSGFFVPADRRVAAALDASRR